jgi:hypothetical protein
MASLSYRMALVSPPKMSSSQLKIGHVIQRQSQFMSQASVEIAGLGGEQLSSSAEKNTSVEGLQNKGNPVHKWLINDG